VIRVSELTVGYGPVPVIDRLSFFAGPETGPLVLAGRNGSGKSTLLRALLGQLPFKGTADWPGEVRPGWLPQNYGRIPGLQVEDFVALGMLKQSRFLASLPAGAPDLARAVLEQMDLAHLSGRLTDHLSGGEWQMVCLAQLRLQDSPVWLLDEPTASLDIGFKTRVFNFLWEEAGIGRTILVATHDLPFLPENGGSYLFLGPPSRRIANEPGAARRLMDAIVRNTDPEPADQP
jgi:ABC-type Mn2+/Zn2+ transport system ATPase subunit